MSTPLKPESVTLKNGWPCAMLTHPERPELRLTMMISGETAGGPWDFFVGGAAGPAVYETLVDYAVLKARIQELEGQLKAAQDELELSKSCRYA